MRRNYELDQRKIAIGRFYRGFDQWSSWSDGFATQAVEYGKRFGCDTSEYTIRPLAQLQAGSVIFIFFQAKLDNLQEEADKLAAEHPEEADDIRKKFEEISKVSKDYLLWYAGLIVLKFLIILSI